jgi:hypothetical protein
VAWRSSGGASGPPNSGTSCRRCCVAGRRQNSALPARLARISHHATAAARDRPMSTALRSVGVLDVLFKYACARLGRAPCIHGPLPRLASPRGEKRGLDGRPRNGAVGNGRKVSMAPVASAEGRASHDRPQPEVWRNRIARRRRRAMPASAVQPECAEAREVPATASGSSHSAGTARIATGEWQFKPEPRPSRPPRGPE